MEKKQQQQVTFIVHAVFTEGDAGHNKRQIRQIRSDIKKTIQSNPGIKITKIENQ
jgi:ribosomal protein S3